MRPACSWRGVFIDSAHTFWPVPHVELLLTIMARYHLNILHWRLANDTAWRIPIPSFHLLTGARAQAPRPATDGHAASLRVGCGLVHPPHCACGFYSEANIRHLVAYAAARDIRIIPEISFPPRTDAPIRTYPTMSNPGLVCSPHTGETAPWPHTAPHRCLLEDTAGISEGRAPIQTRGPVPPSGARSGAGMEPHPARLL